MFRNKYVYSCVRVIVLIYLYVFMEWLFFVTKPSFLSVYPLLNRGLAIFISVWPFLILALFLHACMCVLGWLLSSYGTTYMASSLAVRVVPAFIVSALTIILVDNFTYTAFHWGIVKTNIYTIPLYWAIFLGSFVLMIARRAEPSRRLSIFSTILLATSAVLFAGSALANKVDHTSIGSRNSDGALPNIIMFASDGVNASHLSAYGYMRDTTPNLDKWLDRALVAENAFTNSGMTAGSLTAMMTSKYPATTKVFYPPQTLHGSDAFEQLPEILRQLGYSSLQETVYPYADAMTLNWQDSFDYANGRKLHWSVTRFAGSMQTSEQLARRISNRARSRAEQLLLIRKMNDDYAAVTSNKMEIGKFMSDADRMSAVLDFIRHAKQPFFIHIHLMGTHLNGAQCCMWQGGGVFKVGFDATPSQKSSNALDNAIFQSDKYFGKMMDLLGRLHLFDKTVVVYTSDHATGWDFRSRVPMIFIFPADAHVGRVEQPTQLMDVAPTLLDYLGFNIPGWMEGRSLLHDEMSMYYPIFVGYHAIYWDPSAPRASIGPPMYNLGQDGLLICDRWYVLALASHKITTGKVADFQGACDDSRLPSNDRAKALMTNHLHKRGFEF